ncbi:hypothetical protein FDI24_gp217 [Acidovorax phage ACP17]|uniref:Mycobacteriophage Barnyard protein gp56 n=1 Tax=Acidovorax phage ACP17 TaxID=2010329 RepID=A0A218M383_9CAUD|nr:hypothetical protein FDI24_gp217 [Acidovorax phage ACP17]ASD50498.1 hypothetical protein [Acidovorax phage ACP17]
MAHEITNTNGMDEMAFTGSRAAIWHGLGQELPVGASIAEWRKAAGMDWEAMESLVSYNALGETKFAPDKKLLFRSDNKEALGIVGSDYKIVQPGQVLGFFDDLTKLHGMRLSTAGTLFGGKRFWALAETSNKADVVGGDEVGAYLLLTTSVDGTMSTQARYTSIRVVCNNTLTIALSGNAKRAVKMTHHREWDPTQVKIDMGLLGESWAGYLGKLRALSEIKMSEQDTRKFYEKMFYNPSKAEPTTAEQRTVDMLMEKAFAGIGSEMSAGTAWGALNGATELYTHWKGNRDLSRQFWDAFAGEQSDKKDMVLNGLVEQFEIA